MEILLLLSVDNFQLEGKWDRFLQPGTLELQIPNGIRAKSKEEEFRRIACRARRSKTEIEISGLVVIAAEHAKK